MPGTVNASAMVSQPFSSAKVNASASAPSVPVANIARAAIDPPASGSRFTTMSRSRARRSRRPAAPAPRTVASDRAVRCENRARPAWRAAQTPPWRSAQHRHQRTRRAALRRKFAGAEQHGPAGSGGSSASQNRSAPAPGSPALPGRTAPAVPAHSCAPPNAPSPGAARIAAAGTAPAAASVRQAMATVATVRITKAMSATKDNTQAGQHKESARPTDRPPSASIERRSIMPGAAGGPSDQAADQKTWRQAEAGKRVEDMCTQRRDGIGLRSRQRP